MQGLPAGKCEGKKLANLCTLYQLTQCEASQTFDYMFKYVNAPGPPNVCTANPNLSPEWPKLMAQWKGFDNQTIYSGRVLSGFYDLVVNGLDDETYFAVAPQAHQVWPTLEHDWSD